MSTLAPRVVIVTRKSEYQALLDSHGTRGQVDFFLQNRNQSAYAIEAAHNDLIDAVAATKSSIPDDWSVADVDRDSLDRFLFRANDIIIAVGQDGLVANLAKYCREQPVIGVTPGEDSSEGVLTTTRPEQVGALLKKIETNDAKIQNRTMLQAKAGATSLNALNELFIGHRTHQSARYVIRIGEYEEFQSSSGVIVSTGTGATGWARSIMLSTHQHFEVSPTEKAALYFVREPWPSQQSGCDMRSGVIEPTVDLHITSKINEGGAIFADGVERDFLPFDWGRRARISIADRTLNLALPT